MTTTTTTSNNNSGFSETELAEFKESFALFDTEGTGRIGIGDFRAVLESLQQEGSALYPHLDKLLLQLQDRSNDDDDTMDFDDYLKLMETTSLQQTLQADADDQSNFAHVFELFDVDGKGYISLQDLERVAIDLGEHDMTMEELEEMMERAHVKHNGKVTLAEFTRLMTLNLFPNNNNIATTT
jgi:Ca2+-binding EF-hand superfamily protein